MYEVHLCLARQVCPASHGWSTGTDAGITLPHPPSLGAGCPVVMVEGDHRHGPSATERDPWSDGFALEFTFRFSRLKIPDTVIHHGGCMEMHGADDRIR